MTAQLALLVALACSIAQPPASPEPTASDESSSSPPRAAEVAEVQIAEFAGALASGAVPVLVDVRTPGEYAEGHVGTARNIPVGDLGARLDEISRYRDGAVYLICHSGGRSARAAAQLLEAGFANPVNVLGGTQAWIEAGHPVE